MYYSLYNNISGHEPKTTEVIAGSGSNRTYVRLTDDDGHSVIGVQGTSREENEAFIYLAQHFAEKGLPVPRVLAVSDDRMSYLQEDLGCRSLFDALRHGREAGGDYDADERELLHRTITQLPRIQLIGAEGLDFSHCYPQAELDTTGILFDLNYFKYCFLKPSGIDFHEVRLERDFQAFAKMLLAAPPRELATGFLYRDFQARNVMLAADGSPRFIDFQGGRRGPVHYDIASFLWQASARYSPTLREELIRTYLDSLESLTAVDEASFHSTLQLYVLFRTIQVLGAYGYRGYFERKQHFLDSIPPAIENLRQILTSPEFAATNKQIPELLNVLTNLVNLYSPLSPLGAKRRFTLEESPLPHRGGAGGEVGNDSSLRVRIFSFSYKRGIPEDESGNGGGYVFDCRSTHNPGRYEAYKHLTGLDEPVIRFLEDDGEILTFLRSVYALAEAHVERYIQRGFTDLMFSFGCTGGQHRSVYCAQHLAEHLHKRYGIRVTLCHREQGIIQELKN